MALMNHHPKGGPVFPMREPARESAAASRES